MSDFMWIFDLTPDECDGILKSPYCDKDHSIDEQILMVFIRERHDELIYYIHSYAKEGFCLFDCIVKSVCEALDEKDAEIIRLSLKKGTGQQ